MKFPLQINSLPDDFALTYYTYFFVVASLSRVASDLLQAL